MATRRSDIPTRGRAAKPRISEDDRAVWEALTRQARPLHPIAPAPSVKPMPVSPSVAAPAPRPEPLSAPAAAPAPPAASRPALLVVGQRAPGMDNLGWASLTRRHGPQRRMLDLHGRTVQAAYLALHDFLERAHRDGVRHVEIITGRGSDSARDGGSGSGAIRRELPHWLNAPALRRLLLGAAHPHPRNPGSVRLLLRRRKG